jgi:hypothetical protein
MRNSEGSCGIQRRRSWVIVGISGIFLGCERWDWGLDGRRRGDLRRGFNGLWVLIDLKE